MTPLALLRHGPTAWTEEGRIQGWRDIPLSTAGRAVVRGWTIPPEIERFRWVASPLRRAAETALLLGTNPVLEPRLKEMFWGDWEGERIEDLRARLGEALAQNEARGLDFRPLHGESPRDLQKRLRPWLIEVAALRTPTAAVCHQGVIRAVLALATGWDMTRDAPVRLDDAALHLFSLGADGAPHVDRVNIAMESR